MIRQFRLSRPVLVVLALIFAASTILYGILWIAAVKWALPPVQLGYDYDYLAAERAQLVKEVYKGSPAERAGMRAGDRIIGMNGQRI